MPRRGPSESEDLAALGDKGHRLDFQRSSRPHQPSRFAQESPLSSRASQNLKLKDKALKSENLIRPPHADVPLEFVNNPHNGYFVQATYSVNHDHADQVMKGLSKEDELIKYMSKVPGYLQKREKPQDSVLNFGVLDWGRLEKWTHKQSKSWVSDAGSSKPSAATNTEGTIRKTRTQYSIGSHIDIAPKVDFSPIVVPLKGKVTNQPDVVTLDPLGENKELHLKSKLRIIDDVDLKHAEGREKDRKHGRNKNKSYTKDGFDLAFSKGKQKCLNEDSKSSTGKQKCLNQGLERSKGKQTCSNLDTTYVPEISLRNRDDEVLVSSDKKLDSQDAQLQKSSEQRETLDLGSCSQHSSGEQQSIVLLLPKDFSRPCSSELSPIASLHGKLAQHNWGSFSDLFSVDEIHADESFPDVPHSCSLKRTGETENDLDMKLNNLIKAQGVEVPDMPPDTAPLSDYSNMKTGSSNSTVSEAASGSDETAPCSSVGMDTESSRHERFRYSFRSLSFKEGSSNPPLTSVYVKAKSGPAYPEGSVSSETLNSNRSNINARDRANPFRRFLNPLLKSKSVRQAKERSDDLRMKPPIPAAVPEVEKPKAQSVKALLHLTVKSGLPLFKFVVETNDEVLASTVKSLSTFGKDDISLLYTFYSVHKVRRKSSGWKTQKVKSGGFEYTVVGQMKVSKPHSPSWRDQKNADGCKVKESVLYSVSINNSDTSNLKLMSGRELAATVVNMNNEGSYDFKDEKMGHTVVILPGGDHSMPHEGVPSSLINRWKTGGLCDCGGWDEGCKLRILADLDEDPKSLIHSGSRLMDLRCGLYDQGESQQSRPFFKLVPFRDGLFSVEFNTKMSSLQAFSICVAVINSKQSNISSGARCPTDQAELKQEFSRG